MATVAHRVPLAVVCAGTCAVVGVALSTVSTTTWFVPAVLGTVGILLLLVAIATNTRITGDAFSLLNVTAVFYLLTFGVGGLYFALNEPRPGAAFYERSNMDEAIIIGIISWLLLAAGYLLNPLRGIERLIPIFRDQPTSSPIAVASILLSVGWLARLETIEIGRYFHVPATGEIVSTGSTWIITAAATLPTLATAYVGARAHLDHRHRGVRLFYYLLFTVELSWAIPTGSRGSVLTLLVMAAIIQYYGRSRRLPIAHIAIAASVAIIVVLPFGIEYRGDNRHFQSAPRESFEGAAATVLLRSPRAMLETGVETTVSRFSGAVSIAAIVNQGRNLTDHAPGETYWWIAEGAIPRAVRTDKADPGLFGNEFGRTYGIIARNDRITGITVTQPGELYLNFGFLGILIGMPLIGGVYRGINGLFRQRTHPAVLAIFAIVVWEFLNGSESILAVGVFGVLKLAAFSALSLVGALRIVEMLGARPGRVLSLPSPESGRP